MAADVFLPLPGPAPDLLGGWRKVEPEFYKDPVAYTYRMFQRHGDMVGLIKTTDPRKMPPKVFALGVEMNERLTNTALFRPARAEFFAGLAKSPAADPVAVTDLVCMPKAALLMQASSELWLNRYGAELTRSASLAMDAWDRHRNGGAVDMMEALKPIVRRMTMQMVFGFEPEDEPGAIGPLLERIQSQAFLLDAGAVSGLFSSAGASTGEMRKASESALGMLQMLVKSAQFAVGQPVVVAALTEARGADGASLTDAELLQAIAGMYPAIERGTIATCAWAMLMISQNISVLSTVQEELSVVLQGNLIKASDLDRLPYLSGVVKETLRMFPPRALGARVLAEDGDLGAWHLPKGTIVIHSPYVTHRDSAVYDKPELFLPHRYQYHQPSVHEFVPLGDLAPAAPLVEHVSMLLIGAIYQRYRPSLLPNQTIQRRADVALEPAGPLAMFFVRDGMIFPVSAPRGAVTSMVEFGS